MLHNILKIFLCFILSLLLSLFIFYLTALLLESWSRLFPCFSIPRALVFSLPLVPVCVYMCVCPWAWRSTSRAPSDSPASHLFTSSTAYINPGPSGTHRQIVPVSTAVHIRPYSGFAFHCCKCFPRCIILCPSYVFSPCVPGPLLSLPVCSLTAHFLLHPAPPLLHCGSPALHLAIRLS